MSMTKYGATPQQTSKTASGQPGTKEAPRPVEKKEPAAPKATK